MAACGTAANAAPMLADELPHAAAAQEPAKTPAKPEVPALVGPATREQIEGAVPEWVQAEVESHPDAKAVEVLAAVEPGAEVTIFLGTWCGDSRREVSRFWRSVDDAGGATRFKVTYVAVDRQKKEPAGPVTENGIRFLPTFIVRRDGREVGRIVETAPHGIEGDLAALLVGWKQGLVTTRTDLTPAAPAPPPDAVQPHR